MTRTRRWLLLLGSVLTAALLLLLAGGFLGFQAMRGLRVALEQEARGAVSQQEAVSHLQSYAVTGDEAALAGFEEALAYPRAVRSPLQHALDFPGDHAGLEARVAADPELLSGMEPFLPIWRWVGRRPEMLEILRRWERGDAALRRVERLVPELESVVRSQGAGSPGAVAIYNQIHTIGHDIHVGREHFLAGLSQWIGRLERSVNLGFLFGGVFLLIVGWAGVIAAARQTGRAEARLRESESRFRQLAESIREVFWLTDPLKQEMLYLSPAFEQVWGRSVDSVYAKPKAWLDPIHPDDQMAVELAMPLQHRGEYNIQYRITRPDGEVRWIWDRAFPVKNEEGRVIRIAGIAEDITHRKALEAGVVQGGILRGMGRMAGNVAHEFNNLLTTIQGHLGLVLDDLPDSGNETDEVRMDLEAALAASRRGANLTRRLLAASGRSNLSLHQMDVDSFLQEWEGVFRHMLPPEIRLEIQVDPMLPPVEADTSHLREAVVNLVENARNAMGAGGDIRIRAHRQSPASLKPAGISREPASVEVGEVEGDYVAITVEDNGPGIPPEKLGNLFNLFSAEANAEGSMGLGLPAVQAIIRDMGGAVKVESNPSGTRVTLLLPVAPVG
ncbi:MAG: ATP-binding protein [Gemmatimonadota bacterium]